MDILDQILAADEAKRYCDSKGGYTKAGKEILSIPLSDGANYEAEVVGNELTVGETYTVITESGSFSAVCKDFDGGALLGNLATIHPSGENTGESFAVYVKTDESETFGVAIDQNGGSFIKVTTPKTIVPIDPKYLPPVDSITMNGADGKQYKLTVSGGALNIAEVV